MQDFRNCGQYKNLWKFLGYPKIFSYPIKRGQKVFKPHENVAKYFGTPLFHSARVPGIKNDRSLRSWDMKTNQNYHIDNKTMLVQFTLKSSMRIIDLKTNSKSPPYFTMKKVILKNSHRNDPDLLPNFRLPSR